MVGGLSVSAGRGAAAMWARELAVSAPGKVILHGEHAVVLGKVRARRAKKGVPSSVRAVRPR